VAIDSNSFDSVGKIYLNGLEAGSGSFNLVLYRAVTSNYFLGSQSGLLYGLHGYIFNFVYHVVVQSSGDLAVSTNCPESCTVCPRTTLCLNDCDVNEYLDAERECEPCHASCRNGCSNGDVCLECDPTCRTCIGTGIDECVDCWCDADRQLPLNAASCCVCHSGFEERDSLCYVESCMPGCETCISKTTCGRCGEGYMWQDYTCFPCNEIGCERDDDLPECEHKGPRRNSGSCTCDAG
jgi:hypothetical protein